MIDFSKYDENKIRVEDKFFFEHGKNINEIQYRTLHPLKYFWYCFFNNKIEDIRMGKLK